MKPNQKHTPGPWSFHVRDASKPLEIDICGRRQYTGGDKDMLSITVTKYGPDDLEAEANARLIAAAPELLAACEYALEHLNVLKIQGVETVKRDLVDAIFKAKG